MKKFALITLLIMFMFACSPDPSPEKSNLSTDGVGNTETPLPAEPTETPTKQNTAIPTAAITVIASNTQTYSPTISPSWVINFAEPILDEIEQREPDFQDDFSSDTKRWYPISLYGMDLNKALVIQDGVMRLDQAHGISNYYFVNKPRIVMKVEVLHPIDSVFIYPTFYFRHFTSANGDYLNLSANGRWEVRDDTVSYASGRYTFEDEKVEIILIVVNSQVAYYINGIPVAYFDDPRLLAEENDDKVYFDCSSCVVDNVKVWNLNHVSDLP